MLELIVSFGLPAALAFALAFLVESMTEYVFGTPFDKFPVLAPFKWALMYISAGVGVAVSFHYQLDLIAFIQLVVGGIEIPVTWVGIALTGLAVGRGSNYVHQFVSQYFPKK